MTMVLAIATLSACQSTEERPDPLVASADPAAGEDVVMPVTEARALAASLASSAGDVERVPPRTVRDVRIRLAAHARSPRECTPGPGAAATGSGAALRRADVLAGEGRLVEALAVLGPLAGLTEATPVLSGAERVEALAGAARVHALAGDAEGAGRAARIAMEIASGGADGPGAALALAQASAAQAAGRLDEAEARYRQALAGARATTGPASTVDPVRTASRLSANLLAQGRAVAAEVMARDGIALAVDAPRAFGWAGPGLPSTRLAAALRAQGRPLEAEAIARAALDALDASCVAPASVDRAGASRLLVRILAARGDWDGVGAELRRAARVFGGDVEAFGRLHGSDPEPWVAAAFVGDSEDALRGLETLVAEIETMRGDHADAGLELRGAIGLARIAAGDNAGALADLRAASAPYLEGRRHLGRPEARGQSGRMESVLVAHAALVAGLAESAAGEAARAALVDEHFRLAQVLRLGAVQRHFGPDAAEAAARGPELAALAGRRREIEQGIAALVEALDRSAVLSPRWLPAEAIEARRERMTELVEARDALDAQMRSRFAPYADLLAPRPLGTGEVQRLMRPGEATVVFRVGPEGTWAWAIPASGPIEYTRLGVDADTLGAWVATLREALAPSAPVSPPEALPAFDVASAHALFEVLLSPVASGWRTANHLLVVADGPLRALPFAVLPTAVPRLERAPGDLPYVEYRGIEWLGHQHAMAKLPAVASLATIDRPAGPATGGGPYAGFGDAIYAPPSEDEDEPATPEAEATAAAEPPEPTEPEVPVLALRPVAATGDAERVTLADLPPLPGSEREVRAIARALGATSESIFVGQRASERNVLKRDLSRKQVIHLATHLLHPGMIDGLDVPAIAMSHPRVAIGGGDGLVSVDEVLALELDADLVVLTAASASSGPATGGRDVLRSTAALERAFMHAGARAVMSSSWPVHPPSSTALLASLPRIDEAELGRSRSEVLRLAMVGMVARDVARNDDGEPVYAYAHPLFWAPYTLVGDGRVSLR